MQFTYGTTRLLLAVGIFVAAIATARPLGILHILGATITGISVAMIALVARRRDTVRIVRTLLCCGGGMLIAMFFCPAVHHDPGDEYFYGMAGAICGFIASLELAKK